MNSKLSFLVIAFAAAACTGRGNAGAAGAKADTAATAAAAVEVIPVDSLLSVAEGKVGQTVALRGYVTHTCKHSGKRCFLTGEAHRYSVRVEAKGSIGGFHRELTGAQIVVTGTLCERRIPQSEVGNMQASAEARQGKAGTDEEACAAELTSVRKMQEWMREHGKPYYAVYYLNGQSYEALD